HWIERNRPFRRNSESRNLSLEEESLSQRVIRQGMQRRCLNCSPRGMQCPVEGIRTGIVPVPVLVGIHQRQHRPTLSVSGGLLNGSFQAGPHFGEVLRGEPLIVTEAA